MDNKTCQTCHKTLSGRSQLYRHLREVHNDHDRPLCYDKDECMFKCLEGCNVSFKLNRCLRQHLNERHNFNIQDMSKIFCSLKGFEEWFRQFEGDGVQFIRNRGKQAGNKRVTYYSCNRSGISRFKSDNRKRKPKKNGSRKINSNCTSYLKLEELDNGQCHVDYCDFHYGHKIELEHLPLSLESRASLIGKLANGEAQLVRINLADENIELDSIQRCDLLTRYDVKSLKNFLRSNKASLVSNELSVDNIKDLRIRSFSTVTPQKEEPSNLMEGDGNSHNSHEVYLSENVDTHDEVMVEEDNLKIEEKEEEEKEEVEETSSDTAETIEIHYVDDQEEISDSEDHAFGYYVAEVLKRIDPKDRVLARGRINEILQSFLQDNK